MELIGIALFCALISLLSAAVTISIIRLNRGAKVNGSWLLMAIGFLLVGLGITASALLTIFNLLPPGLGNVPYVAPVAGVLLVFLGLLGWRRALKRMLK
jgi:hypothetical protein